MGTQMAPAATIRVRAIATLTTSSNTAPRVADNADEEEDFLFGCLTDTRIGQCAEWCQSPHSSVVMFSISYCQYYADNGFCKSASDHIGTQYKKTCGFC